MSESITSAEARILAIDINHVRTDLARMTTSIESISASLQTLAKLEQGHANILDRLSTNSRDTHAHELRIREIELQMPGLLEMRKWVVAGVVSGIGMMALAMVKLVLIS